MNQLTKIIRLGDCLIAQSKLIIIWLKLYSSLSENLFMKIMVLGNALLEETRIAYPNLTFETFINSNEALSVLKNNIEYYVVIGNTAEWEDILWEHVRNYIKIERPEIAYYRGNDFCSESNNGVAKYIRIDLERLLDTNKLPCEMYLQLSKDKYVKVIGPDEIYSKEFIQKFIEKQVQGLWVKADKFCSLCECLYNAKREELDAKKMVGVSEDRTSAVDAIHAAGALIDNLKVEIKTIERVNQTKVRKNEHAKLQEMVTVVETLTEQYRQNIDQQREELGKLEQTRVLINEVTPQITELNYILKEQRLELDRTLHTVEKQAALLKDCQKELSSKKRQIESNERVIGEQQIASDNIKRQIENLGSEIQSNDCVINGQNRLIEERSIEMGINQAKMNEQNSRIEKQKRGQSYLAECLRKQEDILQELNRGLSKDRQRYQEERQALYRQLYVYKKNRETIKSFDTQKSKLIERASEQEKRSESMSQRIRDQLILIDAKKAEQVKIENLIAAKANVIETLRTKLVQDEEFASELDKKLHDSRQVLDESELRVKRLREELEIIRSQTSSTQHLLDQTNEDQAARHSELASLEVEHNYTITKYDTLVSLLEDKKHESDEILAKIAEKKMQLAEQVYKIDEQSLALNEQNEAISRNTLELTELQDLVDEQQQVLVKQFNDIRKQSKDIETLKEALAELYEEVNEKKKLSIKNIAEIVQQEAFINHLKMESDNQNLALAHIESTIGIQNDTMRNNEHAIHSHSLMLDTLNTNVNECKKTMEQYAKEIEKQNDNLLTVKREFETLSVEYAAAKQQVDSSEETLTSLNEKICYMNGAVTQKKNEIANQVPMLQKHQECKQKLEKQIEELDSKLQEQDVIFSKNQESIMRQEIFQHGLEKEVAEYLQKVEESQAAILIQDQTIINHHELTRAKEEKLKTIKLVIEDQERQLADGKKTLLQLVVIENDHHELLKKQEAIYQKNQMEIDSHRRILERKQKGRNILPA